MNTENESVARAIQAAVEGNATEVSKEISYLVGNATLKSLNFKSDFLNPLISTGATWQGCYSIGTTAWKTAEDISRGDKVCAGLCIVATGCEGVALLAANTKLVPFRFKVYTITKGCSIGLMRFRNLCRNAKGEIRPC